MKSNWGSLFSHKCPKSVVHITQRWRSQAKTKTVPGSPPGRNYELFESMVNQRLQLVLRGKGKLNDNASHAAFGLKGQDEVEREARLFKKTIAKSFELAQDRGLTRKSENPLFWNLRSAFVRGDAPGLLAELKYAWHTFILRSRFPKVVTQQHLDIADFRFPYEWYPAARQMQRTIHLHVGPTNSGKTYNALKALEAAKSGVYAGPLRLLAHEIYSRFSAKGIPCALVTGEEQRQPEATDSFFQSCTVEMTPLNQRMDVAVIDEIQMINDPERGWAWTQAFLGLQARELHLCGEDRTVEIIQKLCARIGDKCIIHRYQRLNPLRTMSTSLNGSFEHLRKGDAVVAFSRVGLHELKAGIEDATGRRCAIVYGSLPPETRARQAALFNNPDNEYDFLVASDAIGMGLNLEIKRVVFESIQKFDGQAVRYLTVPEIRQIGGRAGRYRPARQDANPSTRDAGPAPTLTASAWKSPGFVTTLDSEDLPIVQDAFTQEPDPIKTAGINPPAFLIERFASFFPPSTPLPYVLARLREMSRLSDLFHSCNFDDMLEIADAIEPFKMSLADRITLLNVPAAVKDPIQRNILQTFARCISQQMSGELLEIKELDLAILDIKRGSRDVGPSEYLSRLEGLHKGIMLYLWLSYRFQGVFQSQRTALQVKDMVETKINDYLATLSFQQEQRLKRRQFARIKAEEHQRMVEEGDLKENGAPAPEGIGRWEKPGHEETVEENESELPTIAIPSNLPLDVGKNALQDLQERATAA